MMTEPDSHTPVRGALIGPWRVLDRVDSGSFGIIFKVALASDPSSGPYAMKLAARPNDARFEREAVLLSRVSHPGLPRYHDSGTWESQSHHYPYVVMQWVEGMPLYQWARTTGRCLTSRQALYLLAQVARALEALHAHGLHRDVKGDNILVRAQGAAVLLDVGACWLPDGRILTEGALPPGTPQYRSPQALEYKERSRGNPEAHYEATAADDVYALGVTAYRLTTGSYPPEPGGSGRFLPPSALATVAPELEALILRMLSHEPEARGTAGELAHALESAAAASRKELDALLLPSAAARPTEHTRVPGPWTWRARVLARAAIPLGAVGALMGLVLLSRELREVPLAPSAHEWVQAPLSTRDGGTSGLADAGEVLASTADIPRVGVPDYALGLPMPKQPFAGQRKPPCERGETAINGGCWVRVWGEEPPCGRKMFDHQGGCYFASFNEPRKPAAEEP